METNIAKLIDEINKDFNKIHNKLNVTSEIFEEDAGCFSNLRISDYAIGVLEDIEEIIKDLKEKYIRKLN